MKAIEVPRIQIEEKIIKVPKITQPVIDTVVQNQVQVIEVEKPKMVTRTVQRKKPVIQEHITHVPKIVKQQVPVQKVVQKHVEVPQIQYVDEVVDVPITKRKEVPTLQV